LGRKSTSKTNGFITDNNTFLNITELQVTKLQIEVSKLKRIPQ